MIQYIEITNSTKAVTNTKLSPTCDNSSKSELQEPFKTIWPFSPTLVMQLILANNIAIFNEGLQ